MYNVKGPSKIVAKTTRRGISQNIETLRDSSKGLDTNDNEIVNPKPVFHSQQRKPRSEQQPVISPEHEEIVRFVHDAWSTVHSESKDVTENGSIQLNGISEHQSSLYYKETSRSLPTDFVPFDLELWWSKRLYNFITDSVVSQ